MFILYDIFFILFALAYLPVLLLKGKWHDGFGQRFGLFPEELERTLAGHQKNIWVHAVSVGEVIAMAGLLRGLKQSFPEHHLVLSTVTTTGHALARKQLADLVTVIWAPVDFSFAIRRFIRIIRPVIYINAETELWPNLFSALAAHKVPIVEVNGRISDKSYPRYEMIRWLTARLLNQVQLLGMQSQRDAARIVSLGAPAERVIVTGNVKFDDLPEMTPAPDLGYPQDDIIWIAGSTHPGEEAIIFNVYQNLNRRFPHLRLIVAPRHVERVPAILELARTHSCPAALFSHSLKSRVLADVIIVDTIGHLKSLYQLAAIVFVGKSLTVHGGHNIIEPAYFGKPVLVGPHMDNFRDIMSIFKAADAVIEVKDEQELQQKVEELLASPSVREAWGQRARDVVWQNRGATRTTLRCIEQIIGRA